jgi:hypothetical protein
MIVADRVSQNGPKQIPIFLKGLWRARKVDSEELPIVWTDGNAPSSEDSVIGDLGTA